LTGLKPPKNRSPEENAAGSTSCATVFVQTSANPHKHRRSTRARQRMKPPNRGGLGGPGRKNLGSFQVARRRPDPQRGPGVRPALLVSGLPLPVRRHGICSNFGRPAHAEEKHQGPATHVVTPRGGGPAAQLNWCAFQLARCGATGTKENKNQRRTGPIPLFSRKKARNSRPK